MPVILPNPLEVEILSHPTSFFLPSLFYLSLLLPFYLSSSLSLLLTLLYLSLSSSLSLSLTHTLSSIFLSLPVSVSFFLSLSLSPVAQGCWALNFLLIFKFVGGSIYRLQAFSSELLKFPVSFIPGQVCRQKEEGKRSKYYR